MRLIELLFVRDLSLSPEALWPHVSDPALISAWASVEITPLDGQPDRREVRMGPLVMTERLLVVEPPHTLVYSIIEGGGLRWHEGRVTLTPTEGGTQLQWHVALQPRLPGTGWIIRRQLTRQFEADLDTLAAQATGPG
ncbi:MAG: hypothetical protein ACI8S6_003852 [Myxococcota bacterium]|jgi:uncharacterized protein YndB with AHSA1/START domain